VNARTTHPAPHVQPTALLFVCLGNICRSPLAEGLFASLATARGAGSRFRLDSCGTGAWHVGEAPDRRSIEVARRHGVVLNHRARQLRPERDFETFDLVLAMDRSNLDHILRAGCPPERAALIRSYDAALRAPGLETLKHDLDVPDPYSGGADGFEDVYRLLHAACAGLLGALLRDTGPTE
jgi:protein-tyrosine phosphatase